jgi:hypothetical protein
MKSPLLRRAALAALALLPLLPRAGAAQSSADFESLLRSGFKDVSANSTSVATPPAQALPPAPIAEGGVFLHSSLDGRVAYCSASGSCKLLLGGGAGVIVLAGPGAFYFTGPVGTGYCTARGCAVHLPGVRVTFPLTSGPKGDIYGSNEESGWHCTPDACRRASSVPLQRYTNYIPGVYKASGDFVSSSLDGTFWCSKGECKRIGAQDMIFIDDNCSGQAPERAVYGFGSAIYRCTAAGCRELGRDDHVDNYVECGFDEDGRLLLPARDDQGRPAGGAILCSENGVERTRRAISSLPRVAKKAQLARSSEFNLNGADGAMYSLASHQSDAAPAGDAARRLTGKITRNEDGRDVVLVFDVPVACWQWTDGDGDEDQPMWNNDCRVIR